MTNFPSVVPVGGKVSMGQFSPAMREEQEEFEQYRAELLACPKVNSNAAATQMRGILVRHTPSLAALFDSLGLKY